MADDKNVYYGNEEVEKPINFKHYFFLFKKHFYIILTFLVITVTLAAIYTSKIPDQYRAEVKLVIERPQASRMTDSEPVEAESFTLDY